MSCWTMAVDFWITGGLFFYTWSMLHKLSLAADARDAPGPMSLAIVVSKWIKSISRSFMAKQGRVSTHPGQVSTGYCFQVKITNSL